MDLDLNLNLGATQQRPPDPPGDFAEADFSSEDFDT
jgi:hypothetical protein